MPIKTFDDGSELTVPMLAGAMAIAAFGGLAIFAVGNKISDMRMRHFAKKYDIPWRG